MALRVLLADESTTIKKVMQLALKDFAVEVRSVHTGDDVVDVARSFQPDIVFADVLLQKKNGYEVAHDLKSSPDLENTPIVLMWSSFLELDEEQADKARVEGRLEKPFDVDQLRKIVIELVPKAQKQRLAHFVKIPDSVTEPLREEESKKRLNSEHHSELVASSTASKASTPLSSPSQSTLSQSMPPQTPPAVSIKRPPPVESAKAADNKQKSPSWTMDSFEDISQFASESATTQPQPPPELKANPIASLPSSDFVSRAEFQPAIDLTQFNESDDHSMAATEDEDPWSHQDLSRFKLNLEPVSVGEGESEFSIDLNEGLSNVSKEKSSHLGLESEMNEAHGSLAIESLTLEETEEGDSFAFEEPNLSRTPETLGPNLYRTTDVLNENADDDSTHKLLATTGILPENRSIPKLDANQLETIIRSQSREIIEELVKRIVPELASELIKQELHRLLEESSPQLDKVSQQESPS